MSSGPDRRCEGQIEGVRASQSAIPVVGNGARASQSAIPIVLKGRDRECYRDGTDSSPRGGKARQHRCHQNARNQGHDENRFFTKLSPNPPGRSHGVVAQTAARRDRDFVNVQRLGVRWPRERRGDHHIDAVDEARPAQDGLQSHEPPRRCEQAFRGLVGDQGAIGSGRLSPEARLLTGPVGR